MSTGAGHVTDPDSVIVDNAGVFLRDLYTVEDFSSGLLHLAELVHEVPELGFSDYGAGCKDDHAVGFGVWVFFRGCLAAYHLVLVHLSADSHFVCCCEGG